MSGVFERVERDGIAIHTVPPLFAACGVGLAFSERVGGTSEAPYASLNLAAHVGDEAALVDANRDRLLEMIGIGTLRGALTTAEQVHGTAITEVSRELAGAGAYTTHGRPPVTVTDALWTRERGVPLMLFFADCVPVLLVRASVPAIAVVHAGRRGAIAGIAGAAARTLGDLPGPDDLTAYVGPHIGACCYEVGVDAIEGLESPSLSCDTFVTITAASLRLDLGAVVAADLERSGVPKERQWHLGICTAHNTDRFYSYRAEGLTGRHGALAVIL